MYMEALAEMRLIVNEVSIKNNRLQDGEFTINPVFSRKIQMLLDHIGAMELTVKIENSADTPFPVDIWVSVTGIFNLSQLPPEQHEKFLKITAVQIVFPYIRTIVSNMTVNALMPPIVLPVIDVRNLFPEYDNK